MKTQLVLLLTITTLFNLKAMETPSGQDLNNSLYYATHNNNEEEVKRLLALGADPNTKCPHSFIRKSFALPSATALICAANHGSNEICTLLLEAGANPSLRDRHGRNAILHAILKDRRETYSLLLANPIVDAAAFYDLDKIDDYFESKYSWLDSNQCKLMTHYCDSICEKWFEDKIDLTQTTKTKMTLLHYVARRGSPFMCERLIKALKHIEASINPKNSYNETPLHLVGYKLHDNCKVLLEYGADVNALAYQYRDNQQDESKGKTPLDSRNGSDLHTRILLNYGADVFRQTTMRQEPVPHIKKIYLKSEVNFENIVLAPPLESRCYSQKVIKTFQLCCKRLCPSLPRDIRSLLLCKLPTNDLGNCMIAQKLKGLPIPLLFLNAATSALHNQTFSQLRNHVALYEREYRKRHQYRPVKDRLTSASFELLLGEKIRQNVIARLAQEKLFCNNPRQVFESDSPQ
jgi:ankyrin repeat protein